MSDKEKGVNNDAAEDTRVDVEFSDSVDKSEDEMQSSEPEESAVAEADTEETEAAAEKAPEENESERYMRLAAEFENYKRRTAREFNDVISGANARLLRQLIDILDNFERALSDDNNESDTEAYRKGVELIYQQLKDLMQRENVTPIEAVGQAFDPNLHEAMMQQSSEEYSEGIISQEFQKGYKLGQKILRHSRVIVSSGPAGEDDKKDENEK